MEKAKQKLANMDEKMKQLQAQATQAQDSFAKSESERATDQLSFQEQLKKVEKEAKKKLKEMEATTLRRKIEHATQIERLKEELEEKHSKD